METCGKFECYDLSGFQRRWGQWDASVGKGAFSPTMKAWTQISSPVSTYRCKDKTDSTQLSSDQRLCIVVYVPVHRCHRYTLTHALT